MLQRRDLVNADPEPKLYRGKIADTASSDDDLVRVEIPTLADDFVTTPLEWDVRVDGIRPSAGDLALVGIDDQGGEWLVKFHPTPS
jgi:hypothetical protein